MRYLLTFILICGFAFNGCTQKKSQAPHADFQSGDIIFQPTHSQQSRAVELATHSKYSHVGIIWKENGKLLVLEAVQPVKLTDFDEFIARGKNKEYVVKRLEDESRLTPPVLNSMWERGKGWLGKNYDIYFNWSDEELYCSELVWKLYFEDAGIILAEEMPLKSYDLDAPLVQQIMRERYGNNIPWDEPMVSPGDLYESDLLKTVYNSRK